MATDKPQAIPVAIVPYLLGVDPSTVTRRAEREAWPLIPTPGLVRYRSIEVAELERRLGVEFTPEQIGHAAERHQQKLASDAFASRMRRAMRRDQPGSVWPDLTTSTEDQPERSVPVGERSSAQGR